MGKRTQQTPMRRVRLRVSVSLWLPLKTGARADCSPKSRRCKVGVLSCEDQPLSAPSGSVLVARQAGTKQATREATTITPNAAPNAIGSRGLTL